MPRRVVLRATAEPGSASIHVPLLGGREVDTRTTLEPKMLVGMPTQCREVELLTLDALDVKDVGFIKIDVEGHELDVLRGGMRTLKASQPRLLIEVEERNRSYLLQQTADLLRPLGYHGCFVAGLQVLDIAAYDPERHHRPRQTKPRAASRLRGHINNFIFVADWERELVVAELQQRLSRFGAWLRFRHGTRH